MKVTLTIDRDDDTGYDITGISHLSVAPEGVYVRERGEQERRVVDGVVTRVVAKEGPVCVRLDDHSGAYGKPRYLEGVERVDADDGAARVQYADGRTETHVAYHITAAHYPDSLTAEANRRSPYYYV